MQATASSLDGPRWTALRVMAGLLKIVAYLEALVGLVGSVGAFLILANIIPASISGFQIIYGIVPALIYLIGGLVSTLLIFLIFYSTSELLLLLIAIENNTRQRHF